MSNVRRFPPRRASEQGRRRWVQYERRKAAWQQQNPNATPAEFSAAMARIARELGV